MQAFPIIFLVLLAACSERIPNYHQDIQPILAARCEQCHIAGGIAPFTFETYEKAKALAPAIKAAVSSREMPPWLAQEADVSYRDSLALTDEQIRAISSWADNDTPPGESSEPVNTVPMLQDGLDRVDLELSSPVAYTPKTSPDDYHCFALPWTEEKDTYLTGFNAIPGNPSIVHHVAVYIIPPDYVEQLMKWDDAEPGPGYTCFGGPSGAEASNIPTLLLGAWIPGRSGSVFPDDIGIRIKPGSYLAMQIHYFSESETVASDKTTLQFRLSETVSKPAVYAPYLNIEWVLGSMAIPAGEAEVKHQIRGDPRDFFSLFIEDLDFSNGFNIHGMMFHMHKLGQKGEVALLKPNSNPSVLLNIQDWDFDWQQEYYLEKPHAFENDDLLKLSCTFDNSAKNQVCFNGECPAPKDVNWGEGTSDEMCVVNMLISPR